MNKSLKTLAAAMLLGSTAMAPFAVAQDATPGTTTTPPAATDGTTTMPAPATPDASMDGTSGSMGTTAQAPADAAGSATYLTEQAESQISVSDFMGQAIYTADNQSIGDINDLLVEKDGGIVAAVVGVGGFLGIGEKDVAIPFDKITITREMDDAAMTGTGDAATTTTTTTTEAVADAEVRLTTTETADSLRNAPEFRTLDDQAADAGTTGTMAPTDGTTTSSTDN
ncbi:MULTISPECIES: PRC-barrel domain-containing protein [Rhizobium/Agrobacterium group]|uniref:PRC-barrel domain-containing protein n=1 Tax=Rhizobium/Agrobacterium group TaxID=227290 RepID=UPI0006B9BD7E|nr:MULTISPECIES: PRC-barrel domain-containing protein [Rhizobium/Agrobacterium group]AOG08151.1 PRC-barrel domain protein [Agrobacterium sp. RAC06]KPF59727.1 photosystem reaction center subunit H [Rhizobium sp. AAP116]QGG89517.1 photosystem reaction center subunit H [Agrobacterium sp. MA01]